MARWPASLRDPLNPPPPFDPTKWSYLENKMKNHENSESEDALNDHARQQRGKVILEGSNFLLRGPSKNYPNLSWPIIILIFNNNF